MRTIITTGKMGIATAFDCAISIKDDTKIVHPEKGFEIIVYGTDRSESNARKDFEKYNKEISKACDKRWEKYLKLRMKEREKAVKKLKKSAKSLWETDPCSVTFF
jgi:hypothetical protein